MRQRTSAFTLVELIVVITIVGILSTVGFVSYSNYLTGARDSNRISQLVRLSDALQVYSATKNLPLPDDKVDITASGSTIAYQGYLGTQALETIDYTNGGVDPKDKVPFTYYVNSARSRVQLLAFMEEAPKTSVLVSGVYAVDYGNRYPKVYGKKLGILTDTRNTPVQALNLTGEILDIFDTNGIEYKSFISDSETLQGNDEVLWRAHPRSSCARLMQSGVFKSNGEYDASIRKQEMRVYCHADYIKQNFYNFIEDGDFEDMLSNNWDKSKKSNTAARSGSYGFSHRGSQLNFTSNNFTYINKDHSYRLKGFARSAGVTLSRFHYGFMEFDENFIPILHAHVAVVPGTETYLSAPAQPGQTTVVFDDINGTMCNTWATHPYVASSGIAVFAFDVDHSGGYYDLPNRNVSTTVPKPDDTGNLGIISIVDNGSTCTATLHVPLGSNIDFPVGTPIRMHYSGATYNYSAASGVSVPNTWTSYSGSVQGESLFGVDPSYFRRGTRFVKIFIIANSRQSGSVELHVDDLTLDKL